MTSLRQLHQPTSRSLLINNQEYLFFGGTAYLGLLVNSDFQDLVIQGIQKYGLNNGTSRSNNVQLGIYDQGEREMAKRFNFESAALFSSGYLAAQATVRSLSESSEIYYAPDTHPALWLDQKPAVLNSDFNTWGQVLVEDINASSKQQVVVISNAIDNLRPELYDFSFLAGVQTCKKVTLILDDSHGLGIRGSNQVSADISFIKDCMNIEVIIVASLAKGFGTDAGIVLGSGDAIAKVKAGPVFMGASPSSPGFIHALDKGQGIYHEALHKLHRNIDSFNRNIDPALELNSVPNFPVFASTNSELYSFLYKNGVIISSFPYPLSDSPLLNRIVITALHSQEDILKLTSLLHGFR